MRIMDNGCLSQQMLLKIIACLLLFSIHSYTSVFYRSVLLHCCSAAIENYSHHFCKFHYQRHLLIPALASFYFYFLQQYKSRKIRNIVPCTFCCLEKSFSCINKLVFPMLICYFYLALIQLMHHHKKLCTHCLLNVRNKMRCFFRIGKFHCTEICFFRKWKNGEEPTRILFCERRQQCFSFPLHFSLRNFVGFV